MGLRINRFISTLGIASRRKADFLILENKIKINGKRVKELNYQVNPQTDVLIYKNKVYKYQKKKIIAFNKPKGYICSHKDNFHKKTIFELLPAEFSKYYICGRLDLDSRGLCILSMDGNLSYNLTHPSNEIEKEYIVEVNKNIDNFFILSFKMKQGFFCKNQFLQVREVQKVDERKIKISLSEGKKRHIRRMLHRLNFEVLDLKRIKVGNLSLKKFPIKEGSYRAITKEHIFL